jgi:hypothetical protein
MMRKLIQWFGSAALVAGLGFVAVPAQADQMYVWTTEDGVYSYSDDLKKVPARYKEQVTVMSRKSLDDYKRYTPKDADATVQYERRLTARLDRLRAANSPEPAVAAPVATHAPSQFSIATGRRGSPRVSLPTNSNEPMIIERVNTRRMGDMVTSRATVVTQGDRTIAIVKGSRNHRNPNKGVVDERDLR